MADLLLELFSEEIPARMQAQAAKDLERLVIGALSDRGLLFEAAKAFSGPRRLTLAINGLPAKQPDVSEEKKGPRINAPEKAIEGFLRSAGVTLEQCEKRDDGKGEFYVAVIDRKGRDTADVLAEVLPEAFAKLPWPKSMRFPGSAIRWVRPLHSIICTLDGEVVPFKFAGVESGNFTLGHRFLSDGAIEVRRFEDYEQKLHDAYVLIDPARRKEIIREDAKSQAFVHGLEPIEDEGLLEEVSGLAEWPVVLTGKIEDQFMDVPAEILQTSMRTHQKYFSTRDPKTGALANRFIVVANMVTKDGGKEIIAGNERVLRARLSDAKFFWDQDRQTKLADRVDALQGIIFHAKLGTQYERVARIGALAGEIAKKIGADVEKSKRAAQLCKADLTTGVVGEFPELQGVMGRYYALHGAEGAEVADAIRDHYKPLGPTDAVPSAIVSMALALSDKFDSLVSFFSIDERPTGSSDPYALRRAALGAIRIILANKIRLPLRMYLPPHALFVLVHVNMAEQKRIKGSADFDVYGKPFKASEALMDLAGQAVHLSKRIQGEAPLDARELGISNDVLSFVADRLKIVLRENGIRHDLVDSVFSLGTEDDLVGIVSRVEALQSFLKTDDGTNLLAGYKRAANILKAEEKKDDRTYLGAVDETALVEPVEKALHAALARAIGAIGPALEKEQFAEAMSEMARLRVPVDAFFESVKVNADDAKLRENRLKLLAGFRASLHRVADFSKIEG
ncbi:MAG TPA: glycine--tRNA ligase subunit beta [Rhizomicrobium sp.]|jgi:glycyl-tRNA synthetase beta chain